MEYWSDEDKDISWLTQVQSIESQKASFEVLNDGDEQESNLFNDIFGEGEVHRSDNHIVSLEENVTVRNGQILYDNVVAEDISSDEEIDKV